MAETNQFTEFVEWRRHLLSHRQLAQPDGRKLYQYRLAESEFDALEKLLRNLPQLELSQISRIKGFSGLFVLYAAEWWRRRFDGSHWSWDPILRDIGAEPEEWSALQRSECVRLGLQEWDLVPREHGGLRFLGAVAVQAGLPLRLLAQARGNIGQLLRQVLKQAGNSRVTHVDLLTWVESLQGSLPRSYRQAAVYTLLAEVAWIVLRLKEEADLTSSADAIVKLDQQVSGWRDRFPLPIEDVYAQGLIEQLVRDAASVHIERHAICLPVERQLVPDQNGGWSLQSNVALPDSIQAGHLAKLFAVTADALPRAGELALTADGHRLVTTIRRMAGHDGYRVERKPWGYSGEISAHEHVLYLSAPDGRVWSGSAPKGEMLDEELPWVFSAEDSSRRFFRQGSGAVAAAEALVALPAGWDIQPIEGSEASACGRLDSPDRELLLVRGVVVAHDGSGLSCRIRTGHAGSAEDSYEWRGQRMWLELQSPTMAFKGLPNLYRINQEGAFHKVDGNLDWSVIGAPGADDMQPIGPIAIRYPATGEVKQRARLVALPDNAALSTVSRDATSGDVLLDNWEATAVRVRTNGVRYESRRVNGTLMLSLSVAQGTRTPERVEIEVFWRQSGIPARLTVPFPGRGVRAFDASGTELRSGSLLSAEQLAGLRLSILRDGGNAHMMLLIAARHGGSHRSYKLHALPGALSVEIRVQDYATDVQHLLSTDDSPDARVRIALQLGGSDAYWLDVARYAVQLTRNNSEVELGYASFATLTPEVISSLPVMSLRLERPGDEAIRLTSRTSEGVPTGSWAFAPEAREPGCWLIYPAPDAQLRFRPMLWTIPGGAESVSPLGQAIGIVDQKEREAALDAVIDMLAADFLEPCWIEVERLAGQIGHLPLATLDIWRRFARSSKGMAAMAIRFGTLPSGFLDRFDQELPFAWEAVPFEAWTRAMEYLHNQCTGGFGEDVGAQILRTHLDARIKDIAAVHGALDYLLGIASASHISEARQQLPALRHVGGRAGQVLFEGENSRLMRLRQLHADDVWPTGFNEILNQARNQAEVARFLCPQAIGYPDGVINMPLLLAAQVGANQTDRWFEDGAAIHALREHRAFDPEWFGEAYNSTIARCLAAGQLIR
jgi:hypothetical protein